MEQSIGALIAASAGKYGDKTALVVGDKQWTFRQIDRLSSQVAQSLEQHGVTSGAVVSIYSPNCAQWVIAYYGILKCGGVVNPLNLMLTAPEAAYAIEDCNAVAVFGQIEKLTALQQSLADNERILISFGNSAPGIKCFEEFVSGEPSAAYPVASIEPEHASTIGYTSGTTGKPKGAVLSHRAILLNTAMTSIFHVRTEADTVVSALPCSHVYGNIVMNSAMAYGMTLVLHPAFNEESILRSIEKYRATLFEGVPTMYMYLLNSPHLDRYDLSSLTRCTIGGQTMPLAKMEQVEARFGAPLIELWGMTELGGLGTTHCAYGPRKLGSIGIPLPFLQARIAQPDSSDITLPPGMVGELLIKGPVTMTGYYHRPEATAETVDAAGWLHSGDLAYMDEDGFIFLVDRLKDMIITGGYNIYPAELERVLCEHPSVAMAAVVGIPDDIKGELAKAFIVAVEGSSSTPEEILTFCRERLAAYKLPREVEFVSDLPKTSSGKIMRRALREQALSISRAAG
ncbi:MULTISPECIES: class I adenylate-forming enzyme family protein [Paraburkholderia]|uniref:Long-chain fatty acid--CoA ligase n=1 Tax=Paraburkholderia podalyriae TaxID=1938811 RepID=A0ABR7Q0M9_9BURK|nr:AMP-binding protein [Paraburkholderia podalyriae]MBC8752101.1 long-chain fatty acid--CoA ligase [Paraburkholderia podalyriae]